MRLLLVATCFLCLQYIKCLPQRKFEDANPRFSPVSFRPTVTPNEEEDDNVASSSQAILSRTPSYGEENYPFRNAIPLVQQRPQAKPQQFQRRPAAPQQFRQQLEEV